jgi:RHS repeat-associated protein
MMPDSTGAKVEGSDVVYTPFGEIRTGELSDLTDFGFTGQILDRSSGDLMYYGARYYLPSLKRFISADTVTPSVLNAQALNRYSYVMNNPIKFTDPTGHEEHSAVYAGSCDLGCWIKRYEELVAKELIFEPTKEKPVGGGYNYSSQWIAAAIEESLKDYGVTVETVDGLHLTDAQKATMYANVAKAVWAMAVAANEYFTENGAPKSSMSDAFKDAYGDQHTITVDPATHPSNCTDQGGTEPNMSCNGGDIGGAKITISLHAVLGIADLGTTQMGDALQPEHLLVHEWGHNYSGPPPDGFNDHREIFDFIYPGDPDHPGRKGVGQTAWELFDIRFGDHNYENSEVTADAFTNWVFNSFLSSESQNVTNTWMCGVMEYTTGVGCQD